MAIKQGMQQIEAMQIIGEQAIRNGSAIKKQRHPRQGKTQTWQQMFPMQQEHDFLQQFLQPVMQPTMQSPHPVKHLVQQFPSDSFLILGGFVFGVVAVPLTFGGSTGLSTLAGFSDADEDEESVTDEPVTEEPVAEAEVSVAWLDVSAVEEPVSVSPDTLEPSGDEPVALDPVEPPVEAPVEAPVSLED
jgi:hypothetical protein